MPIGFKLDSKTHDLVYSDGALELVDGTNEISRNIKTRLLIARGEYLLNVNYGFPYRDLLGSKIFNPKDLETTIKSFILDTQGVVELTRFTLDFEGGDTRSLLIDFAVLTIHNRELDLVISSGL